MLRYFEVLQTIATCCFIFKKLFWLGPHVLYIIVSYKILSVKGKALQRGHEYRVRVFQVIRNGPWIKGSVDLAELARLRQIGKLAIEELAAHFQVETSTIKDRLRQIRRSKCGNEP